MKCPIYFSLLFFFSLNTFAMPIVLDFSSGTYSQNNTRYEEDGFNVTADYGFHSIRLGTLAWYETTNTINVSTTTGSFDLESLTVANPSFAGLRFESSKGGQVLVGRYSGVLNFYGESWSGITSFTIKTILSSFDILNQIDSIHLNTIPVKVSEPTSHFLILIFLLLISLKHYKSINPAIMRVRAS